jgi:chromosome segregation ATPase
MRVSESKDLTVAEQPQQLITIEPAKYVELVFEPFAKRLADAKTLAAAAKFDVTTTAGMAVAVKYRATFREIRVASEKARKERKAPILEIGKLLDSRQKEIEAEIEPFESRFDAAIKAEEKRKDDEKIARAVAESARITAIRQSIEGLRAYATSAVGRSSMQIAAMIETLEGVEITLETHKEFAGEGQAAQVATLAKLGEMLTAQQAHEAEAKRLQAEREALERQRAELAEQERKAAAARAEQEKADREAREAEEARLRAIREAEEAAQREAQAKAAAAMRQQQAEHEARMAAERAEFQRQQDEMAAKQRELREATERLAREQREREEATAAAAKLEADHGEALEDNAAIDALRKLAAEARRQEEQRQATEAERQRRERVQFEKNGPGDVEMVKTLAAHYDVTVGDVMGWMKEFDYTAADKQLAAENTRKAA